MNSLRVSSDIDVTIIENVNGYVQCKLLNVWSVYFFFDTLPCQNYFFQEVWGEYKIVVEIPEGWMDYFSGQKLEIPGRRGVYVKLPPWWGYGYFLELHNVEYTENDLNA